MAIAAFFSPEIVLTLAALVLLTVDFMRPKARLLMTIAAYAGVLGALACLMGPMGSQWPLEGGEVLSFLVNSFAMDHYDQLTKGFMTAILVGTVVAIALSQEDESLDNHRGTYLSLLLFATLGCVLLVKARDFIYAFLALELISISSFILVAFERKKLAEIEGALKYFLVGAFSSAIALYGISLCYMATGSTGFAAIRSAAALDGPGGLSWLAVSGLLLVFVSFGFKASIVPFHFWVPDAYQAAPTPFTAYLSVVPKVAALGLLAALMALGIPLGGQTPMIQATGLIKIMAVLAILTMTIGNVSAIGQNDLKRLLAYSSIAQAGYMMIGILAASRLGGSAVAVYAVAYMLMNMGAFGCVIWVAKHTVSYDIKACEGLAANHLPFALTFTAFLLSLAGIPPLAGFLAKYLVFASALEAQWAWWVAVAGVLNSVISVYYYLRISHRMFFVERAPDGLPFLESRFSILSFTIMLLLAGTVLLGIYPKPLLALMQ